MSGRTRAAFLLAAWCLCAAPRALTQAPAPTAPTLQELNGVAELRTLFDADRDKVRIVLLLSPT